MATLRKDTTIGESDLLEYLNDYSDFAFELRVLNELSQAGFSCEHGGCYTDPHTKKPREFDIRATKEKGVRFLRLAVECKNLRPHYPLLISCVPRREDEAFHEIVISVDPDKLLLEEPPEPRIRARMARSKNVRMTGAKSLYRAGQPVGKSCAQVGRAVSGDILAGDAEVFDKWSQALSSADDLTYLACSDGEDRIGYAALSLVLPILVVPKGQLWMAEHDSLGNRLTSPRVVDRCSYFVDRRYFHAGGFTSDELTISHLEFVTIDGLLALIDELIGDGEKLAASFPWDDVVDAIGGFFSE